MNASEITLGELTCRVVDNIPDGRIPRLLVILNHGFGATGDDLVSLAPWLMDNSDSIENHCRFVFPEAPVDLTNLGMPGGRAWWPINMQQLAEINQTHDYAKLTQMEPPGMKGAAEKLHSAVQAALQLWEMDESRLVIGGFSQGAMVSTCVTLSKPVHPAMLVLFSGTLLHRAEWARLATEHTGCKVLQSHGRQDPILPFEPAVELCELLKQNGFATEFIAFNGPHTIPMNVLERFGAMLDALMST